MDSRTLAKVRQLEAEIAVLSRESEKEFEALQLLGKSSSSEYRIIRYKLERKYNELGALERKAINKNNKLSATQIELERREKAIADSEERIKELEAEIGSYAGTAIEDLAKIQHLSLVIGRERSRHGTLRHSLRNYQLKISIPVGQRLKTYHTDDTATEQIDMRELAQQKLIEMYPGQAQIQQDKTAADMDVSWLLAGHESADSVDETTTIITDSAKTVLTGIESGDFDFNAVESDAASL